MARGFGVVLALTAGCSLIGARVPDKPPPPTSCPHGVVMADMFGAGVTLASATALFLLTDYDRDPGALSALIFGVPLTVVGLLYAGSTIYGTRARNRCERMQEGAVRKPAPAPSPAPRAKVIGDKPMFCALTERDVGLCFTDEAACTTEAERTGITCEQRTSAFCFDAGRDTTCAVSPFDCDARRMLVTAATECGPYEMRPTE